MQKDKLRKAATVLAGLTNMEWLVLKDAVDMQFDRKVHRLQVSAEDMEEVADRIEREWAGMMD